MTNLPDLSKPMHRVMALMRLTTGPWVTAANITLLLKPVSSRRYEPLIPNTISRGTRQLNNRASPISRTLERLKMCLSISMQASMIRKCLAKEKESCLLVISIWASRQICRAPISLAAKQCFRSSMVRCRVIGAILGLARPVVILSRQMHPK